MLVHTPLPDRIFVAYYILRQLRLGKCEAHFRIGRPTPQVRNCWKKSFPEDLDPPLYPLGPCGTIGHKGGLS
jgi:hypothetical protein